MERFIVLFTALLNMLDTNLDVPISCFEYFTEDGVKDRHEFFWHYHLLLHGI